MKAALLAITALIWIAAAQESTAPVQPIPFSHKVHASAEASISCDTCHGSVREMDVMQREYRLRAAAFYADAGNRLRNAGSWDKEDAQYKQHLAEKQKTLDTAKEDLQDLKERARKAGVPSSMIP